MAVSSTKRAEALSRHIDGAVAYQPEFRSPPVTDRAVFIAKLSLYLALLGICYVLQVGASTRLSSS